MLKETPIKTKDAEDLPQEIKRLLSDNDSHTTHMVNHGVKKAYEVLKPRIDDKKNIDKITDLLCGFGLEHTSGSRISHDVNFDELSYNCDGDIISLDLRGLGTLLKSINLSEWSREDKKPVKVGDKFKAYHDKILEVIKVENTDAVCCFRNKIGELDCDVLHVISLTELERVE